MRNCVEIALLCVTMVAASIIVYDFWWLFESLCIISGGCLHDYV